MLRSMGSQRVRDNLVNKQQLGKMYDIRQNYDLQFSSVTQLCPTLCDPMNHSTPGLPVHHQLPEFTQIQVHWVGDAIQPSHPLLSPSPPAPNPSQHQGLFKWVSSLQQMAKGLEYQLQHQSFQWIQWKEFHFLSNVSPHFTSYSRMYGFRWVITPLWSSGLSGSLLDSSSVYSCHLFLVLSLFGIKYGVERCRWAQSWQELDF